MPKTLPILTFPSAAALTLALSQAFFFNPSLAAEPPTASAATSESAQPVAEAAHQEAVATPSPAEAARAKAEERRAAMDAERAKRYAELRAHAAELGVEMPETPPWESARAAMPAPPATPEFPSYRAKTTEEIEALRQQHQAMRDARWKRMREDAAARGVEMPETAPWADAEKRQREMAARYQEYRKTIQQMTDEQREAARAMFSRAPAMPRQDPTQNGYYHGYQGWDHPCHTDPYGMSYPSMMPDDYAEPGYDQGPPPPQGRYD